MPQNVCEEMMLVMSGVDHKLFSYLMTTELWKLCICFCFNRFVNWIMNTFNYMYRIKMTCLLRRAKCWLCCPKMRSSGGQQEIALVRLALFLCHIYKR